MTNILSIDTITYSIRIEEHGFFAILWAPRIILQTTDSWFVSRQPAVWTTHNQHGNHLDLRLHFCRGHMLQLSGFSMWKSFFPPQESIECSRVRHKGRFIGMSQGDCLWLDVWCAYVDTRSKTHQVPTQLRFPIQYIVLNQYALSTLLIMKVCWCVQHFETPHL